MALGQSLASDPTGEMLGLLMRQLGNGTGPALAGRRLDDARRPHRLAAGAYGRPRV